MKVNKVDILAFGAHPDDVECAVGGVIMKQIINDGKVAIVDLTKGELGSAGTPAIRHQESLNATKILGVQYRESLSFEDGDIENNKINRLLVMEVIRKYQPHIILTNALHDKHPDHAKAAQLITEAAFFSGLSKIETKIEGKSQTAYRPLAVYHYIQDYFIIPDFVVDISDVFDGKMEAIKSYKSQFLQTNNTQPNGANALLGQIEATNKIFGRAINVKYAEGFSANRYIGAKNIMDLI